MNKKVEDSDSANESEKEEENLSLINDLAIFPKRLKSSQNEELADEETFEKIKKLLTCPICMEIFQDPVYIKDCSHRFCKQCIEKSIRLGYNAFAQILKLPSLEKLNHALHAEKALEQRECSGLTIT